MARRVKPRITEDVWFEGLRRMFEYLEISATRDQQEKLFFYIIATIGKFIRDNSDKVLDVGLFSFALNMANLIMIIGLGFNSSNSVDIYKTLGDKHLSNKDKKERLVYLRKTFTYIYLGCSCIIAFLGYIFVPLFFPLYTLSKNYFLILMVYGFFQCLYLLWTNYLFYFKKTRNLMIVTFGSSILHLVLSLLLTRYSLYFTVIIYCFTQGVVTLLIRNIAKKELNCQLK